MNCKEYIVPDTNTLLGKPCVKNTKMSAEFIAQLMASGWIVTRIYDNYPS